MALDILFKPSIIVPILLLSCYLVYSYLNRKSHLPDIPWLGYQSDQWFARTRCRLRQTNRLQAAVREGYEKYSRKGLSCIIPIAADDMILLPPASTQWILSMPDSVLSALQAQMETLQTDYTLLNANLARQPHQNDVIRIDLTRQLGNLTGEIMSELEAGFDETWGLDSHNWNEIVVHENMTQIVARTSNRVFVGLPLCRNKDYLHCAIVYAKDVHGSGSSIRALPKILRPVLAPFILRPHRRNVRKAEKFLFPEIKQRISALEHRSRDPEQKASQAEPNDYLQWTILYARTKFDPSSVENSPSVIAGRMMAVNFAAIFTSAFGITHVIFDLISSDPSLRYVEQLREEAASVLAEDNGVWTKHGLAKMHKTDSALRESLRLGTLLTTALVRKVVAKGGVTTPSGVHCPQGSSVCVPSSALHIDEENYSDAFKYDMLRYVKQKAAVGAVDANGNLKKANYAAVTTSAEYLAFAHGRHACLGRFFAIQELKLLLAYMVLNYDIEPLEKRPENIISKQSRLPPMTATIKVRRRKLVVEAKA